MTLRVLVAIARGHLNSAKRSTVPGNGPERSDLQLVAVIIRLLFHLCISSSHMCSVMKCSRLLRMKSNGSSSRSFICNLDKTLVTVAHLAMR